jgi:uncharacterized protein (DUF983 family)
LPDFEHSIIPVSPIKAGLVCCCPKCGKGKLYKGWLNFSDRCSECGLDYTVFEKGDGPAVFIILIMGFIVVGFALVVEVKYQPALWLHALLWGPTITVGSILMLRPVKGLMIAIQYVYKAREGRLEE